MKLRKHKLTIIVTLVLLIIVSVSSFLLITKVFSKSDKKIVIKKDMPLILIPGTSATGDRFDDFITQMAAKVGDKDVIKLKVQPDGTVEWSATQNHKLVNPFIVISFVDSSEETVGKQAKWVQLALKKAHTLCNFDTYNAIGHSNGGLAWTIYLEQAPSQYTQKMQKLITLGTPFDTQLPLEKKTSSGVETIVETDMLKKLVAAKRKIPKSLDMISIAGEIENNSGDGVVPLESVSSSKKIFQGQVASFTQKNFYGSDAQHSELIGNPDVMNYIIHELYANLGGTTPTKSAK